MFSLSRKSIVSFLELVAATVEIYLRELFDFTLYTTDHSPKILVYASLLFSLSIVFSNY